MKRKIAFHIAGMVFVAALFLLLLGFVQEDLVERRVEPIGMRLPEWLSGFRFWGRAGIATSLVAGLFWYVLAQWKFKINYLKESRRRVVWASLFLLPVLATIAAAYFTKPVQEGAWLANAFYGFNALAGYYLETALFSPSSFKYTPVGAQTVRVWEMVFVIKVSKEER